MSEAMIRWVVLLSLLLGCHSVTLEADPMTPPTPTVDAGPMPVPPPPVPQDLPGETPVRRLSLFEYQRTLHDLVGDASVIATGDVGPRFDAQGVAYNRDYSLQGQEDVLFFLRNAESVAAMAVQHLDTLLPCPLPAAAADEDNCAHQFILRFGKRAYRRALRVDEVAALLDLFHAGRTGATFTDGIRVLMTAIFQSPFFLYHWEVAMAPVAQGTVVQLDSYQMASRLSYSLWSSMPDDELFTAADAGFVSAPAAIEAQARRMIADPRFIEGFVSFVRQWLRLHDTTLLDKSAPAYTPELARSMMKETTAFVAAVMAGGGRLEDLLTSSTFQIDPALGALYGVAALTGGDLRPATLDRSQRAGILTQGAFLASNADADNPHPVNRGLVVTRQLLCLPVDDESDNMIIPAIPDPPPGSTNRQRWELHGAQPCAVKCHSVIDPAGFAFEEYDAIGAFRTLDMGKTVDASGIIPIPGNPLSFRDAPDLVRQIARRDDATSCLARQWLRFALGRLEGAGDQRSLQTAGDAFRGASYDVRTLLTALTGSRAFTHRMPSAGEGTP
jgi:hypothetical protein